MKRSLLLAFGAIVLATAGWLIWDYLQKGELVINTSPNAEILLINAKEPLTQRPLGKGHAVYRGEPGFYTVIVTSDGAATRRSAQIIKRSSQELSLELKALRKAKKLASYTAKDLQESSGIIKFTNIPARTLYEIPAGQTTARLIYPEAYPVQEATWLSADSAVITKMDGSLWRLRNGKTERLVLPGVQLSEAGSGLVDLKVNQAGQVAYVANKKLYTGSIDALPSIKKIDDLTSTYGLELRLSATGSILVFQDPAANPDQEEAGAPVIPNAHYVLGQGKSQLQIGNGKIQEAEFNHDGSRLLVVVDGVTYLYDLDGKQGKPVFGTLVENFGAVRWLSKNSFVYFHDGSLWRHDLGSNTSYKLLATAGQIVGGTHFFTSPEAIYFATAAPGRFGTVGGIYSLQL